jgi:uncharacterized protein with PQ loop repeat
VLAAAALAIATTSYHHAGSAPATSCGLIAGGVGVCTSWPQVWRLWVGREHAGLALSTNVMAVLYGVAWLLYGVLCHSEVQVLTSAVGLVGASAVLAGHLLRARVGARGWLPGFALGVVVVIGACAAGRATLGVAASAATIAGVVPQVLALVTQSHDRSARGVSRARWALAVACNTLWVGYGAIVGDRLIVVNSLVIAALAGSIVVLATRALPETADPRGAAAIATAG